MQTAQTVVTKKDYDSQRNFESVRRWLGQLSDSPNTIRNALRSVHHYSEFRERTPDELIEDRVRALRSDDPRVRCAEEDYLLAFNKKIGGSTGWMMSAFAKSFFRANHVRLDVKLKQYSLARETEYVPSDEELRMMLSSAGTTLRAILLFLIESGARIGSVLQLQYRDLREDFERQKIPCAVHFPNHKTKGRIAYTTFIGKDSFEAIKSVLDRRKKGLNTADGKAEMITDDSYVFVSKNGTPFGRSTTERKISDLAKLIGINRPSGTRHAQTLQPFYPHVLRKRFQTILESTPIDSEIVSPTLKGRTTLIPPNWCDYLMGHKPRATQQAGSYSRPHVDTLRRCYEAAMPRLSVLTKSGEELQRKLEDERKMFLIQQKQFEEEKRSWETRFEELASTIQEIKRLREQELQERKS